MRGMLKRRYSPAYPVFWTSVSAFRTVQSATRQRADHFRIDPSMFRPKMKMSQAPSVLPAAIASPVPRRNPKFWSASGLTRAISIGIGRMIATRIA